MASPSIAWAGGPVWRGDLHAPAGVCGIGRLLPLQTPRARALGFVDDGSLPELAARAIRLA